MCRLRLTVLVVALSFCGFSRTAAAFSIVDVDITPAGTLTPADDIALVVGITTPNQDAMLFQPTVIEQSGNAFTIDIFITDGQILPATDFLEETVALGMLAAGEYSYVIRLTAGYFVDFGVREVTGTFAVVPLPATLWLALLALGTLVPLRRAA